MASGGGASEDVLLAMLECFSERSENELLMDMRSTAGDDEYWRFLELEAFSDSAGDDLLDEC